MREIKYRAWLKNGKWMEDVVEINFYDKTISYIEDDYINTEQRWIEEAFENIVLMQSTGLKDKNGKEIYEGDIVRVMDNTFAIVKYSDDRGAYYLDCEKKIGDVGLICQYDTIKRVGNVYENPELLESEEQLMG